MHSAPYLQQNGLFCGSPLLCADIFFPIEHIDHNNAEPPLILHFIEEKVLVEQSLFK
jgi:hypothetical protein